MNRFIFKVIVIIVISCCLFSCRYKNVSNFEEFFLNSLLYDGIDDLSLDSFRKNVNVHMHIKEVHEIINRRPNKFLISSLFHEVYLGKENSVIIIGYLNYKVVSIEVYLNQSDIFTSYKNLPPIYYETQK